MRPELRRVVQSCRTALGPAVSPESGEAEDISQRLINRREVGSLQGAALGRKEALLYHLESTDANDRRPEEARSLPVPEHDVAEPRRQVRTPRKPAAASIPPDLNRGRDRDRFRREAMVIGRAQTRRRNRDRLRGSSR